MFIVAGDNPRPPDLNDSPGLSIRKTNCAIQRLALSTFRTSGVGNWSPYIVLIPLTVIYPVDTECYPTFQQPGPGRYVLVLYPVYSPQEQG